MPDQTPAHPCGAEQDAHTGPKHRAWIAFHRAMMGHRQLMLQKLAEQGVPPGQAMCLRALAREDGLSQRELAQRLHVAGPTVSVMLGKMEAAGVVTRRPDEHDQRLTRVYVTDAGADLQESMRESFAELVETAMGALPESDQLELERLLTALADRLDAALAGTAVSCAADEEVGA